MASGEAPHAEPSAPEEAEPPEGFVGVLGAGGLESAVGPQPGAYDSLVDADDDLGYSGQRTHEPASAIHPTSFWKATSATRLSALIT